MTELIVEYVEIKGIDLGTSDECTMKEVVRFLNENKLNYRVAPAHNDPEDIEIQLFDLGEFERDTIVTKFNLYPVSKKINSIVFYNK